MNLNDIEINDNNEFNNSLEKLVDSQFLEFEKEEILKNQLFNFEKRKNEPLFNLS